MSVIQALWKLRQEDHELQASLLYRFLVAMGGRKSCWYRGIDPTGGLANLRCAVRDGSLQFSS